MIDDDLADEDNKDKDMAINDERSIAADSLKELNKLSNDSQEHPGKEAKKEQSFISMKQKDSKDKKAKDDTPKN